ncbi:hypothetical protein NLG97_g6064 [Lecanicillium saksenae]|uniref:Uncharacterized protein n=1 Tax=Lecanicillium saksenae TaxID=468837 RepID=A0ACC1QUI4_9HYPO|nr:hypothetical protein NLG97_g6064 [Lecanicillium saksenae]
MTVLLNLASLPTPLVGQLLISLLPTASAAFTAPAAESVDTAGFWLGFSLLFVISAAETVASVIWTQVRVTLDDNHTAELSCRVCGREIFVTAIDPKTAAELLNDSEGVYSGFYSGTVSSMTMSNDMGTTHVSNSSGSSCGCCCGWQTARSGVYDGTTEVVLNSFGSLMMIPTLLVRRFNPAMALNAPAGLFNNVKDLTWPRVERTVGRVLEHAVHLLVGLADVALGIAGLALNPGSPEKLYETLRDKTSPMTFESYFTLFLLYWLLGALLLLCMIPLSYASGRTNSPHAAELRPAKSETATQSAMLQSEAEASRLY